MPSHSLPEACDRPTLLAGRPGNRLVAKETGDALSREPTVFSSREPTLLSRESTLLSPVPDGDSEAVVEFALSSLEELQPSLTQCIVAALRPQLKRVRDKLRLLKEETDRQHALDDDPPRRSPRSPHGQSLRTRGTVAGSPVSASELASAVSAALTPRFDHLERSTASASTAPMMPVLPESPTQSASPRLAAAVVDELLPQIKGPVAAAIDNIVANTLQASSSPKPRNIAGSSPKHRNVVVLSDGEENGQPQSPTTTKDPLPSPRLPAVIQQQASRSSCATETVKRNSSLLRNRQPDKAFVVNFRRLVEVQKILSLIHLFIKSTAIATLTLVSAAYWTDMLFSITFVGLVLALYAIHEIRHDRMDIEDYKALGNLLEDDDGSRNGIAIENPNRLLKALSLSSNHARRFRASFTIVIAILLVLAMWVNVFCSWSVSLGEDDLWLGLFDEYDISVQATQLLIGTAMIIFHTVFELLYWRETQCVMPWDDERNKPWDPRKKQGSGTPPSFSWFGLPSMWFSSREAYDDLRLWITLSRSTREATHVVTKIFPEEMALFALDPDSACDLRKTLKHAKLFSLADWKFLLRDSEDDEPREIQLSVGSPQSLRSFTPASTSLPRRMPTRPVKVSEEPEELGIELVLYDSATGQYLEPHPHAEYRSSLMQLLTRSRSPSAPRHAANPWDSCSPTSSGLPTPGQTRSEHSRDL